MALCVCMYVTTSVIHKPEVCIDPLAFMEILNNFAWNNRFTEIQIWIWKKFLQVERVYLEFIGNAMRYIHTHYAYAIAFIVYSIQVLICMMMKFRITKEKEKEEHTIKRPQKKKFFLSIKAYVKRSDVAYF